MRNLLLFTAVAAVFAWSAQAQTTSAASQPASPGAEPPSSAAPPASTPSSGAATGASANTAAAAADLAVGLSVKDSTGAAIGQVTDLKTDAAGKRVATIKMGASTFAVDADRLAVENGAATINATQAQLRDMMKKPK